MARKLKWNCECCGCGMETPLWRKDAAYCSSRCRQREYRARKQESKRNSLRLFPGKPHLALP